MKDLASRTTDDDLACATINSNRYLGASKKGSLNTFNRGTLLLKLLDHGDMRIACKGKRQDISCMTRADRERHGRNKQTDLRFIHKHRSWNPAFVPHTR